MNNEKSTPAPAAEPKPESFAPSLRTASPAPAVKKYCGPAYKFGIVLPGTTTQLDPKRMTEAEIADLIARYPEAANWWK